jgi:hypothetical protein
MPINGNGVLEVADPNNALDVDDRNCDEFDDYKTLGCTCWNINAVPPPTPDAPPKTWADAACQASPSEFCRTCIKDWPKTPGSGANRIKVRARARAPGSVPLLPAAASRQTRPLTPPHPPRPPRRGPARRAPQQVANTASWTTALLNKDPLAKYIIANTNSVRSEFFWCDHTFTHQVRDGGVLGPGAWGAGSGLRGCDHAFTHR